MKDLTTEELLLLFHAIRTTLIVVPEQEPFLTMQKDLLQKLHKEIKLRPDKIEVVREHIHLLNLIDLANNS